jgi:transcriptional regulator with XRE-family HTH domain
VSEQALPDWEAVGEALEAQRNALKMTQDELHVAARVSISVIAEIEKAEKIRNRAPGTLERLSRALDWPANHLDNILNRHPTPVPATPEQPAGNLTPAEEAFRRSVAEKLDNLNGKLDALLKHHDIVWQSGHSSETSVELPGYDHGHEPPKPKNGGPTPTADE